MLKDIVMRQQQEKEMRLAAKYVERTKYNASKKWLDSSLIKVIIGPRRAGKSIFAFMLLHDRQFMYFNFDDDALTNIGTIVTDELMKTLHAVYGDIKNIFFDEIQNLPAWELFVNRLQREGYNLVITGSNANLLSQELATALTGRHIPIEIFTFDFKEFLRAKNFQITANTRAHPQQQGKLLGLVDEYLHSGGFPEVVVNNLDPREYLGVLFDSLLLKDVVKRHKIKLVTQISNLGSYLINNFATTYSLRKLQAAVNLNSITTTEKYTKYLQEAYLIFPVLRYSFKSTQRIKSPKKVYTFDNGFIQAKAIQHSQNNGRLMENLVFTELVKRGIKPNNEFFYYKTRNDREIDFVVKNDVTPSELIQVCYACNTQDIEQREVKALIEASEELKVNTMTVVTFNEKRELATSGRNISFIPLWEWLNDENKPL